MKSSLGMLLMQLKDSSAFGLALAMLLSTCRYVGYIKSFHLKLKIKTSIMVVCAINRNFTPYYLFKGISGNDIL